ncbi:MAG TPA: recombinase family protein [Hyphomonadaceae bacterium]|jgi:DNA invertase Pin-like site-specific DNA recombinase
MKIGYAGAGDEDLGTTAQTFELRAAGCTRLYEERFTGKTGKRPRLRAMLEALRPGDTVIVTRLDRLARSTADLLDIASRIRAKSAGLLVLDLARVDNRAEGRDLIPVVLDTIAAFDRRTSLEREVEPAQPRKASCEVPLRAADEAEVRRLRAKGFGPMRIARKLKIGAASVYGALVSRPVV